jgi:hypothetical protein
MSRVAPEPGSSTEVLKEHCTQFLQNEVSCGGRVPCSTFFCDQLKAVRDNPQQHCSEASTFFDQCNEKKDKLCCRFSCTRLVRQNCTDQKYTEAQKNASDLYNCLCSWQNDS